MSKSIQLCLVFRDMWQSAGKYVPRVDQLARVAEPIIRMGCFSRIETNGGGFEQINLLFGENPNLAVRQWTAPFNQAGIQTQMLERALNGLRMKPVPADVRHLLFQVKKKQGTDISRSFCGLNDPRNMKNSIRFAKQAGMIAQAALSLTYSKLHTVDYYVDLAEKFLDLGADEICIKDMAGIGRPASIGRIIKGIKKLHPNVLIQYHGHSGPGFSVASSLEAARSGADIIDVSMDPLSWGTGHADLLTIHAMLKDAGFLVPDIDLEAYMEVRSLIQEFIDDFLGYFINPKNRLTNSLLIAPGLPGGMMGSLMADLEKTEAGLNKWLGKRGKPRITQDQLLNKLFKEVEFVWPEMGYPPLVTPYSQYVKNVALMNIVQMIKGYERWSMIDENTWGMLLGKSGKVPGEIGTQIKELAASQGREFFKGDPQSLYPDELPLYKKKMKEKGWPTGQDDEELMEYAMHPNQYEEFKSGKAKANFDLELASKRSPIKVSELPLPQNLPQPVEQQFSPKNLQVTIDGQVYQVAIEYPEDKREKKEGISEKQVTSPKKWNGSHSNGGIYEEIISPLEGKFYLTRESSQKPVKVGDFIHLGDTVAYIESMKVINAITSDKTGVLIDICFKDGDEVEEDDVLLKLQQA